MKNRITNVIRIAAATTALFLAAGAAQAQTVLKFSHTDNPGGSRDQAAQVFAEKVKEYTDGRYEVAHLPRRSAGQ